MTDLKDKDAAVMQTYAKAVVHMRRQIKAKRFGLILGAGASSDWKVPTWPKLNERIANDTRVGGTDLLKLRCSETIRTQRLFERYKEKQYAKAHADDRNTPELDRWVKKEWRKLVHGQLYNDVRRRKPRQSEENYLHELERRHPYISSYVPIIRNTALTVNYNFDDFIERIIANNRTDAEKSTTRGFEAAWDIRLPFRSDQRVIYHPNGYLPLNLMEASEEIVLLEDEFADQLQGAMTGQHASLMHHLSKNTVLLIGLSLEDATLKHLLRQSARANPGHYHYLVHFVRSNPPTRQQARAIISANFNTYNLVTLFLSKGQIASLGRLIASGWENSENRDESLKAFADSHDIRLKYPYYIVGAIGAGKSTVVMHLRSFVTHDEWFEPRSLSLGKQPEKLSKKELRQVDRWIEEQFQKKNSKLSGEDIGIFIVDRAPLDPICFAKTNRRAKRAQELLDAIVPGENQRIVAGKVLLLLGDPETLALRVLMTEKQYDAERLKRMQDDLKKIYGIQGTEIIHTSHLSLSDIIRIVARIILLDNDYRPADLHRRLRKMARGGPNS